MTDSEKIKHIPYVEPNLDELKVYWPEGVTGQGALTPQGRSYYPLNDYQVEELVWAGKLPPWVIDGVETVTKFGGEAWGKSFGGNYPKSEWKSYGYVIKPRWNPEGLGRGVRFFDGSEEQRPPLTDHDMIQHRYIGAHDSIDVVIRDGEISWGIRVNGEEPEPSTPGIFKKWTIMGLAHKNWISKWIKIPEELSEFTGVLNFELIGGNLIEVHFRPSLEFFPMYGSTVIMNLMNCFGEPPEKFAAKEMHVVYDPVRVIDPREAGELSQRKMLIYKR